MDWNSIFAISAAGMQVEQARFNVSAVNLANANTVMGKDGSGFRPKSIVTALSGVFSKHMSDAESVQAPMVTGIIEQNVNPKLVYEPGNPAADEKGFVRLPGVNTTTEMLNIVTAIRAYESNVVAMNAAKSMAQKALEIGNGS